MFSIAAKFSKVKLKTFIKSKKEDIEIISAFSKNGMGVIFGQDLI